MNRVVHFEIHASDVEAMKKFYSDVFGWEMQQMGSDYGNYVVVMTGPGMDKLDELPKNPGINGGMMMCNAPKAPAPMRSSASSTTLTRTSPRPNKPAVPWRWIKCRCPAWAGSRYFKDPDGNLFGMIQLAPRPQHRGPRRCNPRTQLAL